MDVRASNFAQALEDIGRALQEADFVAIDLELTGTQVVGEPDSYADTAIERLEKALRIAESFAPIQLGITIHGTGGKLSSYSIMMAPESTFLCDVEALRFLRRHNIDLNVWVDEGVRYVSQEEAALPTAPSMCQEGLFEPLVRICEQAQGTAFKCQAQRLREARQAGLDLNAWVEAQKGTVGEEDSAGSEGADQRRRLDLSPSDGAALSEDLACRKAGLPMLWRMLKAAGRPLVVHCGLLDVLFLLASFEQRVLPREPAKLAQLLQDCLPSGVYDTALLHESLRHLRLSPLRLSDFVRTAREHHQRKCGTELQFVLEGLTAQRYGSGLHGQGEELIHEAGFDSFLTAVLFSHLQDDNPSQVSHSNNRFYIHKSTDYLSLKLPAGGNKMAFSSKVHDGEKLVVATLCDQDAQENTRKRISEARRQDREYDFFYRKIDDSCLLIPNCEQAKLVKLAAKLPGVEWKDFYSWQKGARQQEAYRDGIYRPLERSRRFVGTIKSFSPQKGYGFIVCQDCFRIYGCDVFLHQLQAACFQEGQHVSFVIQCNANGQPQARDLEEQWFTGVVRTLDVRSGFGRIACPTTYRMHSVDAISRNGQLSDDQVGECIHFTASLTRGQLLVQQVRRTLEPRQEDDRLTVDLVNQILGPCHEGVLQHPDRRLTRSVYLGG